MKQEQKWMEDARKESNIQNYLQEEHFWLEEHRLTFQLCSLLLRYPDMEWAGKREYKKADDDNQAVPISKDQNGLEQLKQLIMSFENIGLRHCFEQFFAYVEDNPYELLCENYVRWFDFSDRATLYLTHQRFGENQERGLAFVKLKMEFAKANFYIKNDELPDYLPLILEFVAYADEKFVKKIFLIHKQAIDQLLVELEKDDNPYANLLKACVIARAPYITTVSNDDMKHNAG